MPEHLNHQHEEDVASRTWQLPTKTALNKMLHEATDWLTNGAIVKIIQAIIRKFQV